MQLANYNPPVPPRLVVHNIQHPRFQLTSKEGVVLTDLHESETEYTIVSDLPGVLENDLQITYEGPHNESHIVIETKRELKYDGITHTLERVSGDFKRRVAVPHDADVNGATATFSNGVLAIVLPKISPLPEEKSPKKIIPIYLLK